MRSKRSIDCHFEYGTFPHLSIGVVLLNPHTQNQGLLETPEEEKKKPHSRKRVYLRRFSPDIARMILPFNELSSARSEISVGWKNIPRHFQI